MSRFNGVCLCVCDDWSIMCVEAGGCVKNKIFLENTYILCIAQSEIRSFNAYDLYVAYTQWTYEKCARNVDINHTVLP